jgi:hypothetical protein
VEKTYANIVSQKSPLEGGGFKPIIFVKLSNQLLLPHCEAVLASASISSQKVGSRSLSSDIDI